MFDFNKALGLITAITSATKRLSDTREEVKVNDVAIQLQGIVLDLQAEMMVLQSDYQNILRSNEDLEKKLVKYEKWDNERSRYHLQQVWQGAFVYALNSQRQQGDPNHWLCPNCYDDGQKSILQQFSIDRAGMRTYRCLRCKNEIFACTSP